MNAHEKKGWIERLQALDEPTKQKVLVVSAAILMAVVIYFWLAYFNNLVAGIAQQPAAAPEQPSQAVIPAGPAAQDANGGQGILQNIEGGIASMYARFMRGAHALGNVLQAPRQYIINPK